MPDVLPRTFYERSAVTVARELLGARLVRLLEHQRLSGTIVEAEAYQGEEDLACHARVGRTPRTVVMYGPGGHAYVYFTYGVHWMLNVVTEPKDFPAAVLIRSLWPVEGIACMSANRPIPLQKKRAHPYQGWLDGPAKICRALAITGQLNGVDLCDPEGELFIEADRSFSNQEVSSGPRIGISTVPEPWKTMAWRFLVRNHPLQSS